MRRLEVRGTVDVPGDKSISHRALILSALGTGVSEIRGVLDAADTRSTAGVLRAMGWDVPPLAPRLIIRGGGLRARHRAPRVTADCGNSGTTTRLLAGVAAAQQGTTRFDGDASLRRRPMARVATPLREMGAGIAWLGDEGRLPMEVTGGPLHAARLAPDVASAQVKSAILLAGLCGGVPVAVREVAPTRDHTERMLRTLGVSVQGRDGWIEQEACVAIPGATWDVPGDPSSAAFFAVLAAGAARGAITIRQVLLNDRRVGFLRVMERMGVVFDVHDEGARGGEVVGDLVVNASSLRGTAISPAEIPDLVDEVPILCILAVLADGETTVRGASELRTKESDRIALLVENLRSCGVVAEEHPDGVSVRGGCAVQPATIRTGGDHRMAMAFAILSALTGVSLAIDDPGAVAVSYPTFWNDLARLTSS